MLQKKLTIVDIELKEGEDDPQLIFESLNSTGLDLTEADRIRNFILMGQSPTEQEHLYKEYWYKIQQNTNNSVSSFIRDYLAYKQRAIPNENRVYISFKIFTQSKDIYSVLEDLLLFSKYYNRIITANYQSANNDIDIALSHINQLEVRVSYPFLLELFDDLNNGILTEVQLEKCLDLIQNYIIRRQLCGLKSNPLNKIFINVGKEIKSSKYFTNNYDSLLGHIMPQTLSKEWKNSLGTNFPEIHSKYLHVLGNLTLTGYNSKLSNKSFVEKQTMENGFKDSRLYLNKYLAEVSNWGEEEIKIRHKMLVDRFLKIFKYPTQLKYDSDIVNIV